MDLLPQVLIPLLIIGVIVYLYTRRNRERARNAPLRGEIEMRVCFETTLNRVSILGTGGFGGTRGMWIPVRGPKRLIVGTDAFMISAPQALREFVFRGPESSIAFSQAVNPDDCIMITGQADGRQVQLAITGENLQDIWQALAGTGAALVLRIRNHPAARAGNPQLRRTWSSPIFLAGAESLRVGAGSRLAKPRIDLRQLPSQARPCRASVPTQSPASEGKREGGTRVRHGPGRFRLVRREGHLTHPRR